MKLASLPYMLFTNEKRYIRDIRIFNRVKRYLANRFHFAVCLVIDTLMTCAIDVLTVLCTSSTEMTGKKSTCFVQYTVEQNWGMEA